MHRIIKRILRDYRSEVAHQLAIFNILKLWLDELLRLLINVHGNAR